MASIIIVEDERLLGQTCAASLSDDGHDVTWVATAEEAQECMATRHTDLALLDIGLPGMDGIELLEHIIDNYPDTVNVMMTAQGDVRTAVRAIKLGASDFLVKPLDLDALSALADRHLRQRRMARTWQYEQKSRTQQFGLHQLIGDCPAIERAKALVRRLSRLEVSAMESPPNILITGETGTGKDLLARAFHYEGPRRDGPFVQVNCAALPAALMESELFGHAKGAFTSAGTAKRGLFEVADGGTLFLDEMGSLELPLQAKLLTAIESSRIRPIGATADIPVCVQIIAAMNEDVVDLVARDLFRKDLYHRLRVIQVHMPPLRERGDDLFRLADHFIAAHCRKFNLRKKKLSRDARKDIRRYHWPGNVRELQHSLQSAVLLSGDVIEPEFLPMPTHATTERPGGGAGSLSIDFSRGPIAMENVERELIMRALEASENNVTRAAELLVVSRDTLRYRVEKYGLTSHSRNGNGNGK